MHCGHGIQSGHNCCGLISSINSAVIRHTYLDSVSFTNKSCIREDQLSWHCSCWWSLSCHSLLSFRMRWIWVSLRVSPCVIHRRTYVHHNRHTPHKRHGRTPVNRCSPSPAQGARARGLVQHSHPLERTPLVETMSAVQQSNPLVRWVIVV